VTFKGFALANDTFFIFIYYKKCELPQAEIGNTSTSYLNPMIIDGLTLFDFSGVPNSALLFGPQFLSLVVRTSY
jgi:hypothetical protein